MATNIVVTVWKGRRMQLTREMLQRAARRATPDPITKYVVSVAGKSFPPKQLIAEALGVGRQDFDARQACHWLRQLDYPVNSISPTR